MLDFKALEIEDKDNIESYLQNADSYFCDHCFVDMFLWKDLYNTMFCIKDDFLFVRILSPLEGIPVYVIPIGIGNFEQAMRHILRDAKERNIPFIMTTIFEKKKKELETAYPKCFRFESLRNSADYIYKSQDLILLKGNRYHSKRNQINHFKKMYKGRWFYEEITESNINEIKDFYNNWYQEREDRNEPSLLAELKAVRNALDFYKDLEIRGGLLRLDQKVIAFSMGSQSRKDMFIIHFEKANANITGAYQMINQQFAIANCKNVELINREEDLGIKGLRKAKLSYHPKFLAMKYLARLNYGDEISYVNSLCQSS